MKQLIWALFLFTLFSCGEHSSDSKRPITSDSIRSQAMKMSKSLIERDCETFIEFQYPKVIQMFESKQKLMDAIKNSWKKTDEDTIKLLKNIIGSPTKVITCKDELQCTIPQSFEYKTSNARVIVKSTLIAISQDGGYKWYFIDVVGENVKKIKRIFPNLSSELIVPEQLAPEIIKD